MARPAVPEVPLVAVPLTSYRGQLDYPSFSPDETQVTFQWRPEDEKHSHIYIKQVGVEPPFQLTHSDANDWSPAWSPDGQTIAFIRELKETIWALMLIPQRGGRERQLETWEVSGLGERLPGPLLAWTPDSRWLAFPYAEAGHGSALFLISTETGEKRQLTPSSDQEDSAPAFSPDGHSLVFVHGSEAARSDIYLLPLADGYSPRWDAKRVYKGDFWSAAWTADGRDIVFSYWRDSVTEGLWRIEASKLVKPVRLNLLCFLSRKSEISKYVAGGLSNPDCHETSQF